MTKDFNYPQLTKFEKSTYNAIKKEIFLVSQKLGSGTTGPVPYDTAWVARIPETNNLSRPAFRQCLQWLRDHQKEDGSWGEEHHTFLHSKILNTFAAVLALTQWNFPIDEDRKKRGIEALNILAAALPKTETREKTFEMIISGFMEDARELDLDVSYKMFEWHAEVGRQELRDVENKIISDEPSEYRTLLETTSRGLDLELECFRPELIQYGLIAAQPSTTAYILRYARLRGTDFLEAEWMLEKVCAENKGGAPHICFCDNFEIAHGLDFFFKVGINPRNNVKHSATNNALNMLGRNWDSKNGIGFSSAGHIVDNGCSATALRVLLQFSKLLQSSEPFQKYSSERKKCDLHEADLNVKNNVSNTGNNVNKAFLHATRNTSNYYNILQKVFTLEAHDIEVNSKIVHLIAENQNNDGGWGGQETSSAEETAYVCLSIYCLVQKNSKVLRCINFSNLVDFMNSVKIVRENEGLWCYKVIFHSTSVSEAVLAAANYAIFQIQRMCILNNAFNENQLDCLDIVLFDLHEQPLYKGYVLLPSPEVQRSEIEVNKQEVIQVCNNTLKVECSSADFESLMDQCLELSYLSHDVLLSPYERAIDMLLLVALYLLDDVFDTFLLGKNNLSQESNQLLSIICKILRGGFMNIEEVPCLGFPKFSLIVRWCFHCRKVILEKRWNAESFVKVLEKWLFKGFTDVYKAQRLGLRPTLKRYLQVHKADTGLFDISHHSSLLDDSTADSTEFEHYALFVKYKDYAGKACRIFNDVLSILKDIRQPESHNYCLKLQEEYKIPLEEAMIRAAKKANIDLLKAFSLKRMILADPMYENNKRLLVCMNSIERWINGAILWSAETPRYHIQRKNCGKRVYYTERDSKFIWDLCFK